jgi:hypothetical protein
VLEEKQVLDPTFDLGHERDIPFCPQTQLVAIDHSVEGVR